MGHIRDMFLVMTRREGQGVSDPRAALRAPHLTHYHFHGGGAGHPAPRLPGPPAPSEFCRAGVLASPAFRLGCVFVVSSGPSEV
jgi:hypothetical protein